MTFEQFLDIAEHRRDRRGRDPRRRRPDQPGRFGSAFSQGHRRVAYDGLRHNVGRTILLGLEVLIVADIILTVAIDQTLEERSHPWLDRARADVPELLARHRAGRRRAVAPRCGRTGQERVAVSEEKTRVLKAVDIAPLGDFADPAVLAEIAAAAEETGWESIQHLGRPRPRAWRPCARPVRRARRSRVGNPKAAPAAVGRDPRSATAPVGRPIGRHARPMEQRPPGLRHRRRR